MSASGFKHPQLKDDPNKVIKVMTKAPKEYELVEISEWGKANRRGIKKSKSKESSLSKFPKSEYKD